MGLEDAAAREYGGDHRAEARPGVGKIFFEADEDDIIRSEGLSKLPGDAREWIINYTLGHAGFYRSGVIDVVIFLTYFRDTYLNGRALAAGVDFLKEKVYAIFDKDEVRFMLSRSYNVIIMATSG